MIATVVCLGQFCAPVFALDNKALDSSIQVISPTESGLWIEGKVISVKITTKNITNETKFANIDATLFQIKSGLVDQQNEVIVPGAEVHDSNTAIAAGKATEDVIAHVLPAGNYHVYVLAVPSNGGSGQPTDFFFTVNSKQDLFVKQQADFTMAGAIIAALSAITAIVVAIFSYTQSQKQMKIARDGMNEDRKNSESALRLTEKQMQLQLRPWIGRVDIVHDSMITGAGVVIPDKKVSAVLWQGQVKSNRFKFLMQNYGKLPAIRCGTAYGILSRTEHSDKIEPGLEWLEKLEFHQFITVMPGETFPMNIDVPVEKYPNFYVVGRVKYEYSGGEGFYDFIVEYADSNWVPKYNMAG